MNNKLKEVKTWKNNNYDLNTVECFSSRWDPDEEFMQPEGRTEDIPQVQYKEAGEEGESMLERHGGQSKSFKQESWEIPQKDRKESTFEKIAAVLQKSYMIWIQKYRKHIDTKQDKKSSSRHSMVKLQDTED